MTGWKIPRILRILNAPIISPAVRSTPAAMTELAATTAISTAAATMIVTAVNLMLSKYAVKGMIGAAMMETRNLSTASSR